MKALYKIVHTAAGNLWRDPEKRILDESLWMKEQGHQVVIIAPPDSPLLTRARATGLPTYALSFRGLSLGNQSQQLRDILSNEQPNILNAHGRTDGRISLKAAKRAGVPCRIISRHSEKHLRNTWQNRTLFKKLSHYVFTSSDHTTERLKKTFRLKDMEIFSIPGGVVLPQELIPVQDAQRQMASRLHLEETARFIGLLDPCDTRLSASHAVQVLKAVKQLRMEIPHHLLIPVSAPETRTHLQTSRDKLNLSDRVHFIEPENVWEYYRALSCGIHIPSYAHGGENIPRAMLEAMHASCPIAAHRARGVMAAVSHKETGLLWDGPQPEQAADVILDTLTRTAATKERVHAARETVRKNHSIDTMGRDIIRIYRLHQVRLERRYHKVDLDEVY